MRLMTFAAAIAVSTAGAAQTQGIAVPAYFPLVASCTTSGPGCTNPSLGSDWSRIQRAGGVVKVVVVELDNLGSGDGGSGCTGSPANMLDCWRGNGTRVLGYVFTGSAQRPYNTVLHGGDNVNYPGADDGGASVYKWYRDYGSHIDGIFFDVGPQLGGTNLPECTQQQYYGATRTTIPNCAIVSGLYQALTSPQSTSFHSGPCGPDNAKHACVMVNASQFPNDWIVTIADYLVLWERPLDGRDNCPADSSTYVQNYLLTSPSPPYAPSFIPDPVNTQSPPGWYFVSSTAVTAAHVITTATAGNVNSIIATSRTRGPPGMLYIHDQHCNNTQGAVYGQLSGLFEQLVAALETSLQIIIVTNPQTGQQVPIVLSF